MKKITIWVSWILVLLYMAVILNFSSDNARESTAKSGIILGFILPAVDYACNAFGKQTVSLDLLVTVIRKCAHVFNYFILSLFCCNAFFKTLRNRNNSFCFFSTWVLATGFSALDEFYQTFVPGRSGQFQDVCIDHIGVLAGLLTAFFLRRFIILNQKKKSPDSFVSLDRTAPFTEFGVRMNANQSYLLSLLSSAIRNTPPEMPENQEIDWESIFIMAQAHSIHTLFYPLLDRLESGMGLPSDLKKRWRTQVLFQAAYQSAVSERFRTVLSVFSSANIPVILYKGIILKDLYPYPELRTMVDIDILVKPEDLERGAKTLLGLDYLEEVRDDRVISFRHPSQKNLELHSCILYPRTMPQFAGFEDLVWQNTQTYDYCGEHATVLTPTFNLAHTVFHFMIHYCRNGVGLRQLSDIALFAEKYETEIDWPVFWQIVSQMNAEPFTAFVFALCQLYLNLNLRPKNVRCRTRPSKAYLNIFIKEILDSGVFGNENKDRGVEKRLINKAGAEDEQKRYLKSLYANFFTEQLFPRAEKLDTRYWYAKKHPVLLPVAWIHRMIFSIFSKDSYAFKYIKKLFILTFSKKRLAYLRALGIKK